MPSTSGRWCLLAALLLGLLLPPSASSACPPTATDALFDSLPLESASRTLRFELPVPETLYRLALARPGVPALRREGKLGQGVVVVDLPVERLWMAINDDGHHAEDGYLPLEFSRVLAGEPGRSGRETLQAFESFGIGRWWINRLEMSTGLYSTSGGRLWELRWHDVLGEYPGDDPPVDIGVSVGKLERSEGAWLLVRLGDDCTLIEYVALGEPGGFMGVVQWMLANRALRATVEGMILLAREHVGRDHLPIRFERPDGARLESAGSERPIRGGEGRSPGASEGVDR